MKQKIYVVEGTHDETLLKQIDPNIRTVSVGGSQIKEDVIRFLKTYEDKFQIILLLDPDYTGEQIRKRIAKHLTNPTHIFVQKHKAISKNKKKIGVEHLSLEDLKTMLLHEVQELPKVESITLDSLYKLGLSGQTDSKVKRDYLTSKLNLTYSNSKTLIQRLNWLGLSYKDLEDILYASS